MKKKLTKEILIVTYVYILVYTYIYIKWGITKRNLIDVERMEFCKDRYCRWDCVTFLQLVCQVPSLKKVKGSSCVDIFVLVDFYVGRFLLIL